MDAINWSSSIFELRPGVGESLGSSSSLGFKHPKITSLALALVFWSLDFTSLGSGSIGFQVSIHLHFRIWPGGT